MAKKQSKITNVNKMWGGRFVNAPSELMTKINASINFDQKLAMHDVEASVAHAKMLRNQKIITTKEYTKIKNGLEKIKTEIKNNKFEYSEELEDIHMNIENRLQQIIGQTAGKLHTARSRNDQVATDLKLWVRDKIDETNKKIITLAKSLAALADKHAETIMPGFTHLQTAQPVTFGHHCLAYVEMLMRDQNRFINARERMNECPLGAAALAGTGFDIDRNQTSKNLGFNRPTQNSIDAVSDRDFALEFLACASICSIHLSRLAEEIVLWSTPQFGFITLSDTFSTGSSIMPQKKNPDAAELIRAKTGRINGAFVALSTVMKALPLAYSKDMQEDKEPLFDVAENLSVMLDAINGMIRTMKVDRKKMRQAAEDGYATATEIADFLVREVDMPFRQAHHVTGKIVALAESKKCRLDELSIRELKKINAKITPKIYDVLNVQNAIKNKKSLGGTAPSQVRKQIKRIKKIIG